MNAATERDLAIDAHLYGVDFSPDKLLSVSSLPLNDCVEKGDTVFIGLKKSATRVAESGSASLDISPDFQKGDPATFDELLDLLVTNYDQIKACGVTDLHVSIGVFESDLRTWSATAEQVGKLVLLDSGLAVSCYLDRMSRKSPFYALKRQVDDDYRIPYRTDGKISMTAFIIGLNFSPHKLLSISQLPLTDCIEEGDVVSSEEARTKQGSRASIWVSRTRKDDQPATLNELLDLLVANYEPIKACGGTAIELWVTMFRLRQGNWSNFADELKKMALINASLVIADYRSV